MVQTVISTTFTDKENTLNTPLPLSSNSSISSASFKEKEIQTRKTERKTEEVVEVKIERIEEDLKTHHIKNNSLAYVKKTSSYRQASSRSSSESTLGSSNSSSFYERKKSSTPPITATSTTKSFHNNNHRSSTAPSSRSYSTNEGTKEGVYNKRALHLKNSNNDYPQPNHHINNSFSSSSSSRKFSNKGGAAWGGNRPVPQHQHQSYPYQQSYPPYYTTYQPSSSSSAFLPSLPTSLPPVEGNDSSSTSPFSFQVTAEDLQICHNYLDYRNRLFLTRVVQPDVMMALQHLLSETKDFLYLQQKNLTDFYEEKRQFEQLRWSSTHQPAVSSESPAVAVAASNDQPISEVTEVLENCERLELERPPSTNTTASSASSVSSTSLRTSSSTSSLSPSEREEEEARKDNKSTDKDSELLKQAADFSTTSSQLPEEILFS